MSRVVIAAHQPDLLPYSGFWYKMAKADIFDVKIWDQFVDRGYQRRVQMREKWVSLPLVRSSTTDPIVTRRLKPEAAGFLADEIANRYVKGRRKPPFWDAYGPRICDEILSIRTDQLWDFNLQLIVLVRDILGIETPLALSRPVAPGLRGSAGLISVLDSFRMPKTYLSGTGARAYMGDCREFVEADIPVVWSRHQPVTGDSILSVIFDYEDPLAVVLAESSEDGDTTSNKTLEGALS
jgi:WbqC-like protein family